MLPYVTTIPQGYLPQRPVRSGASYARSVRMRHLSPNPGRVGGPETYNRRATLAASARTRLGLGLRTAASRLRLV